MQEIHFILKNTLLVCQFLAALIGVFYLLKFKKSFWIWFSVYLIIIFIQEYFWKNNFFLEKQYQVDYYVFFGVPLEYIFLYWLYALKSLQNKKLFLFSVLVYIVTIGIAVFFKDKDEVFSISINIGTFILMFLIVLEFIKQIKTDDILKFKGNKMFYINIGLIVFYIGNYPFHVLGPELYDNYLDLWDLCFIYFLSANCIMYLLFSISIIWGKTQ